MINSILSHIDHKSLFNALSEGIMYVQPDGIITFMNNEAKKIFADFPHFSPGEQVGCTPYEMYSKRGAKIPLEEFPPLRALQTGKPVRNNILQLVGAHHTLWVDINADPVEISAEFTGVIVTIVELNDLMEEKQRLRHEEEKFHSFFSANEAATLLATIDGHCLSISKGAERMFGFTGEEWKSEFRDSLFVQDDAFKDALRIRNEAGSVIAEVTGRRKSGETFPLLWQSNIFTTTGGLRLVSAVMHDLSQQKELSREITRASFNLDLILKNTNEGFLITDRELNVVACNESIVRMIRAISGTEISKGDNLLHAIAPERLALGTTIMEEALQGKVFDDQVELEEDGVQKVYHTIVRPLYERDAIIGTFLQRRDVTERFKMQDRLRISNERFEIAAKSSYDLIWELDYATGMVHFNDVMEKVFKHIVASPINREWFLKLTIHPEDEAQIMERVRAFQMSPDHRFEIPPYRMLRGDGTTAWVRVNGIKVFDRNQKQQKVIGVLRDVTESYIYEQQLLENNQRFAMVKKATKDVVFEFSGMDLPLSFSDSLFPTFGYEPNEFNSTKDILEQLVHPDDLPMIQSAGLVFGSGNESILSLPDFRMLHKNGSIVYVEVKFIGVRDENNVVTKGYGNIKNITDRYLMQEELRKSNERFELAAKASYDMIWDVDVIAQTLYVSESIKTSLGFDGPLFETMEWFYSVLLHPDDVGFMKIAMVDFLNSKEQNADLPDHRLLKKDGSYAFVRAKMYGVRNGDGAITRIIGVSADISEQKVYEENLETLNAELQSQAVELKKSNEDLERFAYVASHDLQEPLRMVSSFLSLIRKKYDDILDDTGRQYIYYAVDGAERMKKLILDLLDYSKIGGGPNVVEVVDLNEICREVLAEFLLSLEEKNAAIHVDELPAVNGNGGLLRHVFRNLIGNALKYSNQHPEIKIGHYNSDEHVFFVKDNGIGIDPKYFDKIFVIFQQLHTRSEKGGTGMGLAIAKRIVERHNGRLWVESEEGAGSTFYFTLPKSIKKQDAAASADIIGRG